MDTYTVNLLRNFVILRTIYSGVGEASLVYEVLKQINIVKTPATARRVFKKLEMEGILRSKKVPYKSSKLKEDSPLHRLIKDQKSYSLTEEGQALLDGLEEAIRNVQTNKR